MNDIAPTSPEWAICGAEGCAGSATRGERCLRHMSSDELTDELERCRWTEESLDARGVVIDSVLLSKIRFQYSDDDGSWRGVDIRFRGATFDGEADFAHAKFYEGTDFRNARFLGATSFADSTFHGSIDFTATQFVSSVAFDRVQFTRDAVFIAARFESDLTFRHSKCQGIAAFGSCVAVGAADFERTEFKARVNFAKSRFESLVRFYGSVFQNAVSFTSTICLDVLSLEDAVFLAPVDIGPLFAQAGLILSGSAFYGRSSIRASTSVLIGIRARFLEGVQIQLRLARVLFEDADFPANSVLSGAAQFEYFDLNELERHVLETNEQHDSAEPMLLSLRRSNVAGLEIANLNAADCRFGGAFNLEGLRLGPRIHFGEAPALTSMGRRLVIADEQFVQWTYRASRWQLLQPIEWSRLSDSDLSPSVAASSYRSLRKGFEDRRDDSGASDFYFGEMEMRRLERKDDLSRGGRMEHATLWLYWLVSGYGLKAGRALVGLTGIVCFGAVALWLWGFTGASHRGIGYSVVYSVRSVFSMSSDSQELTTWGLLIQIIPRVLGPIFLGLAFLAIRNRVKR